MRHDRTRHRRLQQPLTRASHILSSKVTSDSLLNHTICKVKSVSKYHKLCKSMQCYVLLCPTFFPFNALTLYDFPCLFGHSTRDNRGNIGSNLSSAAWNFLSTHHTDPKTISWAKGYLTKATLNSIQVYISYIFQIFVCFWVALFINTWNTGVLLVSFKFNACMWEGIGNQYDLWNKCNNALHKKLFLSFIFFFCLSCGNWNHRKDMQTPHNAV